MARRYGQVVGKNSLDERNESGEEFTVRGRESNQSSLGVCRGVEAFD